MLSNVAANPVTALTGRRMGVLRDPEVRELFQVLLAEAVAVGIAEGARLGPEDVAGTMAFYDQFGEDDGTSMLYDRLAGRELENELLSGAITRLGRRHGVPTPTRLCTRWSGRWPQSRVVGERAGGSGLPGSPG
jgi:2-dehydropantoate 2-reductase